MSIHFPSRIFRRFTIFFAAAFMPSPSIFVRAPDSSHVFLLFDVTAILLHASFFEIMFAHIPSYKMPFRQRMMLFVIPDIIGRAHLLRRLVSSIRQTVDAFKTYSIRSPSSPGCPPTILPHGAVKSLGFLQIATPLCLRYRYQICRLTLSRCLLIASDTAHGYIVCLHVACRVNSDAPGFPSSAFVRPPRPSSRHILVTLREMMSFLHAP